MAQTPPHRLAIAGNGTSLAVVEFAPPAQTRDSAALALVGLATDLPPRPSWLHRMEGPAEPRAAPAEQSGILIAANSEIDDGSLFLLALPPTIEKSVRGGTPQNLQLPVLSSSSTHGRCPAYHTVVSSEDADPGCNRWLVSANYYSGSITSHRLFSSPPSLEPTARLLSLSIYPMGPRTDRQEASHPHMIVPVPHRALPTTASATRLLLVPDLGTDRIVPVLLDLASGDLRIHPALAPAIMPPGSGPRHLEFHPTLPLAYVVLELSNQIAVLDVSTAFAAADGASTSTSSGTLDPVGTVLSVHPLLPPSLVPDPAAKSSAIHVSSDGLFVYASVRYVNGQTPADPDQGDLLVAFALDAHGRPDPASATHFPSGGVGPRGWAWCPAASASASVHGAGSARDPEWVAVANQDDDTLVVFEATRVPLDGRPQLQKLASLQLPKGIEPTTVVWLPWC